MGASVSIKKKKMPTLVFVFITISSDISKQKILYTARFHQECCPYTTQKIRGGQLRCSTVMLHLLGGGEQAILRGSLKKETVNFHLSYREKALSFSLTLKRHSESHTTLTRFHYKNVPKY